MRKWDIEFKETHMKVTLGWEGSAQAGNPITKAWMVCVTMPAGVLPRRKDGSAEHLLSQLMATVRDLEVEKRHLGCFLLANRLCDSTSASHHYPPFSCADPRSAAGTCYGWIWVTAECPAAPRQAPDWDRKAGFPGGSLCRTLGTFPGVQMRDLSSSPADNQ